MINNARIWIALSLSISVARCQTPTTLFDKMLSAPRIVSPTISPDAKSLGYLKSVADWKSNSYQSDLWVIDILSGTSTQITRGGNVASFRWAPDSHRLAFIATRDHGRQIYLIDTRGGEASRLTDVKDGVNDYAWSPDGKRLALTTTPPDSARAKRQESLGDFTIVETERVRSRLGLVDVPDGIPEAPVEAKLSLDDPALSVDGMVWSPDSKALALTCSPAVKSGQLFETSVYRFDLDSRRVLRIAGPGAIGKVVWSPDCRKMAFNWAPKAEEAMFTNSGVYVVSSEGGSPSEVKMTFEEGATLEAWSPEGILFSATIRTMNRLYRLNPSDGQVSEITPADGGMRNSWTFSKDYQHCAFRKLSPTRWPEVADSNLGSFADHLLTQNTANAPSELLLPVRELVRWKSKDGAEIEGVLTKPHDFDPKRKYPLLVVIHGGPTGVSQPVASVDYAYPIEAWVNRGALVLEPNYRGSAGYGAAFRALNVRNLGVGDEWDVMSGVDFLVGKGCVDESKMGCMGWSQGGYISAFITTTSTRFKAISAGAGISDWATYYYLTDIQDFTRQYLKATPWLDPDIYRKTSPITYVRGAKTPTLIQQGSNDPRVPVPNGYELFRALQDLHVPSRFILYNGFGHSITKPKEQKALLQHNWEWFGHYIWGDPMPAELDPSK